MKSRTLRKILLFWCWFIGVGAVAGATGMFVDPTGRAMGMDAMLPAFQVLPFADALFQNLVFSGISLLIVNGLSNLTAAVLLHLRKPLGVKLGTCFGFTLMLWITIQFCIFEFNILSTSYFIFGCLQLLTGHLLMIAQKQEAFAFDAKDYPHVGQTPGVLTVYFSRRGYCRKVAYERANALGAAVAEVRTPERIDGAAGFLWAGRFAMHGWAMPVNELPVRLEDYERVIFVTPIWVFGLSSPMRGFLRGQGGKCRRAEYVICHFRGAQSVRRAAAEMDALLGLRAERVESLTCRFGVVTRREDAK